MKKILDIIIKIKNPFSLIAFLVKYCFKEILVLLVVIESLIILIMLKIIVQLNAGLPITIF